MIVGDYDMDLKCKKLDCKYNNKFACMAKSINVANTLCCKKYEHSENLDEDQKQDVPKTMFEITPKYHPYRHSKSVHIGCDAKCLFNQNGVCVANGITVANEIQHAKCYTFAKK